MSSTLSQRVRVILMACGLIGLIGIPLALPMVELIRESSAWMVAHEWGRLGTLSAQTALLAFATTTFAMLIGLPLAVLIERSDLPGRAWVRGCFRVGLFIPLPILAIIWQASFGIQGWLGLGSGIWRPWDQGMIPAIVIHTLFGIPWVIWIVGQGITHVEPALEEDARLLMSPIMVLLRVTLVRAMPSLLLASAVVAVQCLTEIAVTDLMLVRTLAEEVYTQAVIRDVGLARAMAVSLPGILLALGLIVAIQRRVHRGWPPLAEVAPVRVLVPIAGRLRFLVSCGFVALGLLMFLFPMGTLLWKLGDGGESGWTFATMTAEWSRAWRGRVGILSESLLGAIITGLLTATLALIATATMRRSPNGRRLIIAIGLTAWLMPGPLIGIGLMQMIDGILHLEEFFAPGGGILRGLLYDDVNSPVPSIWVSLIRAFPLTLILVMPIVEGQPRELDDQAALDGLSPVQRFWTITWPLARFAWMKASIAGMVIALGEISATKLVQIPGRDTLIMELFNQMHYGVGRTLAALAWMQILACLVIVALASIRERISKTPLRD